MPQMKAKKRGGEMFISGNWKLFLATGISLAGLCTAAEAQQLPKSGSINFQTGYKITAEALTVADKYMVGHGSAIGVTMNDKGSGPLHGGPSDCLFTFFVKEGHTKNKIFCAFGDADGDRIFTDASGDSTGENTSAGINEIIGGTGKYAGIQGNGPWKCKNAGPNGELHCQQRFDYRLP
jgi:hypothetical protein